MCWGWLIEEEPLTLPFMQMAIVVANFDGINLGITHTTVTLFLSLWILKGNWLWCPSSCSSHKGRSQLSWDSWTLTHQCTLSHYMLALPHLTTSLGWMMETSAYFALGLRLFSLIRAIPFLSSPSPTHQQIVHKLFNFLTYLRGCK